jgi:hypothetical protein
MLLAVGDFSAKLRKYPIMPKPKVAIVSVVLIHARVVRSSASCVRNFAMPVRLRAKFTRGSPWLDDSSFMIVYSSQTRPSIFRTRRINSSMDVARNNRDHGKSGGQGYLLERRIWTPSEVLTVPGLLPHSRQLSTLTLNRCKRLSPNSSSCAGASAAAGTSFALRLP